MNRKKPQHNLAKILCQSYTHDHALVLRSPPAANLPEKINIPPEFVNLLSRLIDPPIDNWNDLDGHIQKRSHVLENHNVVFKHILDNCIALIEILLDMGAISQELRDAHCESHYDTIENFKLDPSTGYIEMPYWMVLYYDLLNHAFSKTQYSAFGSALDRFCLTLVYPHQDWSSYNLNLNYRHPMRDKGNNVVYYNVLAGYRMGRSKVHRGTNGDRPAIYLEDKMLITTLFSRFGPSMMNFTRTGLISLLKPEKYG